MKKLMPCLYLIAATLIINNSPLFAQTKNDTLQIKVTVLNYLEGLDTNNPDRVAKAMNPDLAKRTIEKNKEGKEYLSNMTAASLVGYTKNFDFTLFYKKGVDPKEPLKVDVTIYDIENGIATVKALTNKFEFCDYIQLGKINGEWEIVNILWAWTGNTNKWMNKQ
jgi:Putative lumazine-binding